MSKLIATMESSSSKGFRILTRRTSKRRRSAPGSAGLTRQRRFTELLIGRIWPSTCDANSATGPELSSSSSRGQETTRNSRKLTRVSEIIRPREASGRRLRSITRRRKTLKGWSKRTSSSRTSTISRNSSKFCQKTLLPWNLLAKDSNRWASASPLPNPT